MTTKPRWYNGTPIPYDEEIDNLCQIAKEPGAEAWAACIALGYKTEGTAFEFLHKLAVSDDWRYRRIAIEAMAFHQLASTNGAFFCGFLTDSSSYVVRTACQVVAELELGDAHDPLTRLLYVNPDDTRSAALRALNKLWQSSDFDLVLSVFKSDASEQVRQEAAWALRGHADKRNWETLFEAWRTDSLHRHRVWACELAGEFGDKCHTTILQDMFADTNGHVRVAAEHALTKLSC